MRNACGAHMSHIGPIVLEWPIAAMSPAWLDVEARYLLPLHVYPAVRATPARTLEEHTRVTIAAGGEVYAFALIAPGEMRAYEAALPHAVVAEYVIDGPFPYRVRADLTARRMRLELPPETGIPAKLAAYVRRRCAHASSLEPSSPLVADQRGV